MRATIVSLTLAGLGLAASSAAAQTWDRSICPPELSNYGGCPVRVYVAPARPAGFHEQAFGIVRKGYDPDSGTAAAPLPRRTKGGVTTVQ